MRLFVISGFPLPAEPGLNRVEKTLEVPPDGITKEWLASQGPLAGCGIYSPDVKAYLSYAELQSSGGVRWTDWKGDSIA